MNGFNEVSQSAVRLDTPAPADCSPVEISQVEAVAKRDSDARLRHLVTTYLDFVWRYLRRIGQSPADCDEIVQEAFLVASRRLHEIREGCERAYLVQVAANISSTRRRSFSRELVRIDQSAYAYSQEPPPDPEQAIEDRQAHEELDSILAAMPIDLRTVFVLYEIEERNTREIAQMLDLKEGTVASRLRRARSEFHRHIEQRSQPPSPIRTEPARRGAP
jgi:RNA polymerase sigma-70 factor (ECF subfamily)